MWTKEIKLAQRCYLIADRLGFKLVTSLSWIQRPNCWATKPPKEHTDTETDRHTNRQTDRQIPGAMSVGMQQREIASFVLCRTAGGLHGEYFISTDTAGTVWKMIASMRNVMNTMHQYISVSVNKIHHTVSPTQLNSLQPYHQQIQKLEKGKP